MSVSREKTSWKCVKTCGHFAPLASGSITPKGWLRNFAMINADGWLLKQAKDRVPGVYDKLWDRKKEVRNFWDGGTDYSTYFADGLIRYAGMLPDSNLSGEMPLWLGRALDSQDEDGYIGPLVKGARWRTFLDVIAQFLLLEGFLYYYEITGEKRILKVCERMAKPIMHTWKQPGKKVDIKTFDGHGQCIIRSMLTLYALTGKMAYRIFSREVLNRFGLTKKYLRYYDEVDPDNPAPWEFDAIQDEHDVVASEHVGLPATLYEYDGKRDLLRASEAAWKMMQPHLSPDGTPHGNENIRYPGPRANCEHCGAVEWMITNNVMTRITGEVKYADAAERDFFNGYPAAKTPDGMMVAYMHTPNQLVASEWSEPHFDNKDLGWSNQFFSTAHGPLCCNVNGPRAIPYFVDAMILRTGNGLAVVHYGPCTAKVRIPEAGELIIHQDTDYPFEDEVRIRITPEKAATFPMQFRIPGWCASVALEVNGKPWERSLKPGGFATVNRKWQPDDQVILRFEYSIRLLSYNESRMRVGAVAIQRGPLTFSLPIPEDWQLLPKDVKSFQVLPGRGAQWNFVLVIDAKKPDKSFEFVRLKVPKNSKPWEHAPVGLKVKARRVLNWHMEGDKEHPMTPGLPFKPMRLSDKVSTVTLVPFGFTRLRMTYLPLAKE